MPSILGQCRRLDFRTSLEENRCAKGVDMDLLDRLTTSRLWALGEAERSINLEVNMEWGPAKPMPEGRDTLAEYGPESITSKQR